MGEVPSPHEARGMEGHEAPLGVPIELEHVEEPLDVPLRFLPTEACPLDEVPIGGQRGVDVHFEDPHVERSKRVLCVDEQLEGPLFFSV